MISLSIFGTPVKAKGIALIPIVILWGSITWLEFSWHPERVFWQDFLMGFATMLLLLVVEVGHALAHIFSARAAGAPMDELLLWPSGGMPRTLYWNNEVSPNAHRIRASGGPLFNAIGLLLSAGVYAIASGHAIARELAAWSAGGHGLLLILSLLPVPIVDGGTLLKWTLVARGRSAAEADGIIRRVDWVMGIVGGLIGVGFIVMQMWIAGVIPLGIGAVVIAIAEGRIR